VANCKRPGVVYDRASRRHHKCHICFVGELHMFREMCRQNLMRILVALHLTVLISSGLRRCMQPIHVYHRHV
jgi:hypothetical protein